MDESTIRKCARSRVFLSQRTEDEKDRLEMEILEYLSEPNKGFDDERMDDLYLLIRKLGDCAYIGCGVDADLRETYRTTDSGKAYLERLRNHIG